MGRIAARLKELGIELPEPSVPRANYVPWVRTGNQVWIAGQVPSEHLRCVPVMCMLASRAES